MKEGDIFTVIYATECRIYTDAFLVLGIRQRVELLSQDPDIQP